MSFLLFTRFSRESKVIWLLVVYFHRLSSVPPLLKVASPSRYPVRMRQIIICAQTTPHSLPLSLLNFDTLEHLTLGNTGKDILLINTLSKSFFLNYLPVFKNGLISKSLKMYVLKNISFEIQKALVRRIGRLFFNYFLKIEFNIYFFGYVRN